jgi:hypothetical protein
VKLSHAKFINSLERSAKIFRKTSILALPIIEKTTIGQILNDRETVSENISWNFADIN